MKLFKIIAGTVLSFSLLACSNASQSVEVEEIPAESESEIDQMDQKGETSTNEDTDSTKENQNEESEMVSVSVGDPAVFNGIEMTVNKVSFTDAKDADLQDDEKLVNFEFSFKNESNQAITLHVDDFSMENSAGKTFAPSIYTTESTDDVVDETIVEPGGSLNAVVSFIQPVSEDIFTLRYQNAEFLYY